MSNNEELNREYWREDVERIRNDSVHSSMDLANQALDLIEDFIERRLYRNRTELLQSLSKLSNALVRAKPLMALIYSRSHKIIAFIENIPKEERNIENIVEMTLRRIREMREEIEEKQKKITRFGARLILDHHVVFTHSASRAVESILLEARRLKKRFRLICTESRPKLEGAALARRMAEAGIKTRLIPDADIVRALQDAHFVLTGTDRITENTFVNKTGTAAIAMVANKLDKPFYIATDLDKILLKRIYPVRFHSQNPEEILSNPPENLTISNVYFEEIPLEMLHKIICEDGIFERNEFVERFL